MSLNGHCCVARFVSFSSLYTVTHSVDYLRQCFGLDSQTADMSYHGQRALYVLSRDITANALTKGLRAGNVILLESSTNSYATL